MAASSSGDDNEGSLPKYGWRVHLDNTFSHKPQPCYIPRWSQIPRLIGLGWRYYSTLHVELFIFFSWIDRKCCHVRSFDFRFMKYASRERKNGRVPFIDPFATNPCRQVYGESNLIVNDCKLTGWDQSIALILRKLLQQVLNSFKKITVVSVWRHCSNNVLEKFGYDRLYRADVTMVYCSGLDVEF